jgi:hypothetical protein
MTDEKVSKRLDKIHRKESFHTSKQSTIHNNQNPHNS